MRPKVVLQKDQLEFILESARRLYPKETILLLRGKAKKDTIAVSEVLVPPLAVHGRGFSGFPTHMLPMDLSIVGTVHSHPSGSLGLSVEDLNHAMGRIILITGFPYRDQQNTAAYNRDGETLELEVVQA